MTIWLYTIISVILISLISLVGVFTLFLKKKVLENILLLLVGFSAGGLLGDAFIHLLPEAAKNLDLNFSLMILAGILIFFIIEKFLYWQHCHNLECEQHPKTFAIMNLVGDGFHNFIDGLIIGGSYLVSIPLGIATSIAVLFHEIPQEIGDFGVLLRGGFKRSRALLFNLLSGCTAILGAIFALILANYIPDLTRFLIPFTIGGFIYIAAADLIPELHKELAPLRSILSLVSLIFGILVMFLLLFLG